MLFETFKRFRKESPDAAAFLITSGDRALPITWRQFTNDIDAVAHMTREYVPGATVAILGENSYEWMVAHAACLFSGAIALPVDPNLNANDIAKRLQFAGAAVLVHSALYADKAREVADRMPGLVVGGFGSRKTDSLISAALKAIGFFKSTLWDREAVDVKRTSMLVFTSGTTSEPRGVELTIEGIETFAQSAALSLPMHAGQNSLMLLPLHHIFGICAVYAMLTKGVALGVCPDFRRIFDAVDRFRANFLFLVPALADILAAKIELHGKSAAEAFGQPLEWVLTGGASLSRRTYERMTALGVKTISAYGLTETTACYSMSFERDVPRPCSAGKVSQLPGVETKVSPTGELLIRGPNVMKGYYKMPDRTAQVLEPDGWLHTGDLGTIDADGYVWVTGRLSRTIVLSSGKKIAPEELETKILALPGVLEALVTGEGETREVKAEIYASLPEERIRAEVADLNKTLPVYQRIKRVVVRKEPFPRTSSGKIRLS